MPPQEGRLGGAFVSRDTPTAQVHWHQEGRAGGAFPGATQEPPGCGGTADWRTEGCAPAAKVRWHRGQSPLGTQLSCTRCPIVGACVAAKAHRRPRLQLRRYSHPPAPKRSAKPQGVQVGETSLGCCTRGQGALAPTGVGGRCPRASHEQPTCVGTGTASSWAKGAAAKARLQSPGATWNSPMAVLVALLLEVAWLPKHMGRHCGSSGGIPTHPCFSAKARWPSVLRSRNCPTHSPPKGGPSRRAGGWERLASRAPHWRPGCFGKGKA